MRYDTYQTDRLQMMKSIKLDEIYKYYLMAGITHVRSDVTSYLKIYQRQDN